MIPFKSLKQYTHVVNSIRFLQDADEPFAFIYFSENSNFVEDFPKLHLIRQDYRVVVVPTTSIPRVLLTGDLKKLYLKMGLMPYTIKQKVPSGKNVIVDLTQFLTSVDNLYKPIHYRSRAGFLVTNLVNKSYYWFPDNYKKILVYSIDATKDLKTYPNRKIFPFLQSMKDNEFPFEYMLLCILGMGDTKYRLLIKDGNYNFTRLMYYFRNLKTVDTDEVIEDETDDAANTVMKSIEKEIEPETRSNVKSAVKDYLQKDEESREKIVSGDLNKTDIHNIATTSILSKVSGNVGKSKRMAQSVPQDKKALALKVIDKRFSKEILNPKRLETTSTEPHITALNPGKTIGEKTPEHIFEKRQIDFSTNLSTDLRNSFKELEKEDIPLKVKSFAIVEKPQSRGELLPTDTNLVKLQLVDKFKKTHDIEMELPRIDSKGSFRINGIRYILINQIIQCPITFPKPGESRFESSYSKFRIHAKTLRKEKFLETYLVSYRLPLLILLAYMFGFKETLRSYGISYIITTSKPAKTDFSCKINDTEYIIFGKVDSELKKQLCQSFIHGKVDKYKIIAPFASTEYFETLIIGMTGRLQSTYNISNTKNYIVDPVSKEVLTLMQLPTELNKIMKYMAEKAVQGYVIKRNDLANQRIRNSEIIINLAYKQIHAAYNAYRQQVLSGNEDAKLVIQPTTVMTEFVKTELVTPMEYANPMEEMSVVTRLSPTGKQIGGIDKRAMTHEARNIHPSYFGNIDPLDTPESDSIGFIQQLSVDALLHSTRGIFSSKSMNDNEGAGMLSTTGCMVPFIENNEGARVIMMSQHTKQMLPLKNPQPPVVQSGYETLLTNLLSDNFIKRSPCNGKVTKITGDAIYILCNDGKVNTVDITPAHLRSGSGKNTLSVFNPLVKAGSIVKTGMVIAEGACIANGAIALGRPLLVAFMMYKGYNFEDSIVINDRLVTEDKLTSLHGIVEEVDVSPSDRVLEVAEIGKYYEKGEIIIRKTMGEIEEIVGYEEEESTDIFAGQFVKRSPGGRIVDIDVFSNVSLDKYPLLKAYAERTNKKYKRTGKENFRKKADIIKGAMVRFRIEQELKVKAGDKLCNRYGNKGIISLVEKDENMPRTPFGETIDVILNPIGILNRMNPGQLYEMYCGLISRTLGKALPTLTKSKAIAVIKQVYTILDGSKNKIVSQTFISNLSKMSDLQFKRVLEQVKNRGFFPIVVPPFKAPKYNEIAKALKTVGLKPAYQLYLPEYRTKTIHEVPVGYMYISKLEHLGEAKIYGRASGPVTGKIAQPTSGKQREGGQRLGELDTYSFISYNCINVLAEFLGPLSDDYIVKEELNSDILQTGHAKYKEAKITPAKDLLNAYFISLMLDRR
jgi:DNA-directed RNA polymerase beta subunit